MCYTVSMDVGTRELRNNTASVLRRVEAGETVTVTVGGRAVAVLAPVSRRRQWIPRAEVDARFEGRLADRGLLRDLAELSPDTTDDLPLP